VTERLPLGTEYIANLTSLIVVVCVRSEGLAKPSHPFYRQAQPVDVGSLVLLKGPVPKR
jgi:hypothetical protein